MKKLAAQTHKDRVHSFNAKLESLSEHHDIPKVSYFTLFFFLLYYTNLSSFRLDLDKKYRDIVSYLSTFCQCTILLERFVLNLPLEILAFVYMNPSLLGARMTMGPTL